MLYTKIIKPILFKLDPEKIHNTTISLGWFLGSNFLTRILTSKIFNYKNKKLNTQVLGIKFENPIGLSAGFDKDANLTQILPNVGFGFEEIGSITGEKCEGNPKPRLFRLPDEGAIIVNYGLCNEGSERIANKLKKKKFNFPIGISIARANNKEIVFDVNEGIKDYIKAFRNLNNLGDYITINISCPNTPDNLSFCEIKNFERLINEFSKEKITKPIFIKLKPDFSKEEIDSFLKVCIKYNFIKGFVVSNLTVDRARIKNIENIKGGLSGTPTKKKSDELLKYLYRKTKGKYILIGVGGVFNAEDAYEKIKNGASLVQLITGMIYNGPGLIKEINKGLVKLLEKDGFSNVNQAIGYNLKQ